MALSSKYLRFAKATITGVQTVTGVGFEGKALLLWTTYQTSAAATTAAIISLGMTDGDLQSVRCIHHPGGEAATTSSQAEQTDHIAYKVTATSGGALTVLVAGVFGAFTADGFTINWTTNDSDAAIMHAIVLGGDIQAAFTQVKMTESAPADIDVTSVGFKPTAYVVMGGAADEFGTGDYNLGAPFGSFHGFGFSNATDNVCGYTLGLGTGGAADCYKGQLTDAVASIRIANVGGGGSLMEARITANLDNGYTITRDTGSNAVQPVQHVLCLKGVRFALGSFTAPLTATTKVVSLPFEPDLVVLQSLGATASTSMAGMGLSIGTWQRADNESGGVWIGGVDAANPSEYRRSTYEDLVIETRNASGGSAVMQATVDDTDDDSITFDFSAVSGNADAIIYMALAATETIRGAFVAGEKTTVRASRAAAFGLDGAVNEHSEEGKLKVFGKFEATETVTVGDVSGVTATHLIGIGPTGVLEAVTVGSGVDLFSNVLTGDGGGGSPGGSPSGDSGAVVQVVNTQTGAVSTGSTVIPLDDTIPQNTEGNEYMTLAITPTDAANKLRIEVMVMCSQSVGGWVTAALFQDSTAGALAAHSGYQFVAGGGVPLVFAHWMSAGTTSATTFKVRLGPDAASTVTFNGSGGARYMGGVFASSITITEIVP